MRQIVSGALVSSKVLDIFAVAGLEKPDISILSEDFLQEIKNMKHKNLAVEVLANLLAGNVKARTTTNITKRKKYSELLAIALQKYRNRSIKAAQVIEELIELAKDFKKDIARGKDMGLNDEERAFYDALADNESAVRELGDATLKTIALKLTEQLRRDLTIDWAERESIRAGIRNKVRRLLKKYQYPPDKREAATKLVLEQAEALSAKWTQAER